jgi:hypothetical protein
MMGLKSAARVASLIRLTFTALRFGLMVGIAGGVSSKENDIRLGDKAVRQPTATQWATVLGRHGLLQKACAAHG